jgi:hypothetical protein
MVRGFDVYTFAECEGVGCTGLLNRTDPPREDHGD